LKNLLLSSALFSVAVGAAGGLWVARGPSAGRGTGAAAELASSAEGLGQTLQRLSSEHQRLARQLEVGGELEAPAAVQPVEVDPARVQAALEAWAAAHGGATGAAPERPALSEEQELVASLSTDEALALLAGSQGDARARVWRALADTGRVDEVIAALEERAKAGDVPALMALARGCVEAQRVTPDLRRAARLAQRSEEVYDQVLERDPQDFDARYEKAIALARRPAYLGKQAEAIESLEILRSDASRTGTRPELARVYLYLGNLLEQTGERERAVEIWKEGLGLFPGDSGLRAQVSGSER